MDLINALLSPLGFGVPLALLLWWRHARMPRWLWRTGLAVEIACIVFSTPLGADALVRIEENRTLSEPACTEPKPAAVVLLSAGARRVPREAGDVDALNVSSLRRTLAAVRLLQRLPGAQLVITGTSDDQEAPVSLIMARLAESLGVPTNAIRAESAARTTWENARNVRALDPAVPRRIWLVTSALHLPRALVAFRAAGFDPCGYPSDQWSGPFDGPQDLLPNGGAAAKTEAVVHELIGELVYRVRAAIDRPPAHG